MKKILGWAIVLALLVVAASLEYSVRHSRYKTGDSFTVMSFNIGDSDYQFPSADEVAAVVQKAGKPDILLLQEVRGEKQVLKLKQELGYPYHAGLLYKHQDRSCLAILSRYEISQKDHLFFQSSPQASGALCGVVHPGGKAVLVCTVHLEQIPSKRRMKNGYVDQNMKQSARQIKREFLGDTVRSRSTEELIAWIQGEGTPAMVLGGDFNTIPFSKPIRAMSAAFDDALWPSPDYFSGTYFKIKSPLLPRVDYIFHTPDLVAGRARVIRQSPGDHYPVMSEFRIDKREHRHGS